MAYSADTLKQTAVPNLVPNGSDGGIWMSGTAPAADATGNIYLILGNGTFDNPEFRPRQFLLSSVFTVI